MITPLFDAVDEQWSYQLEGTGGSRVKAGPHDLGIGTAGQRELQVLKGKGVREKGCLYNKISYLYDHIDNQIPMFGASKRLPQAPGTDACGAAAASPPTGGAPHCYLPWRRKTSATTAAAGRRKGPRGDWRCRCSRCRCSRWDGLLLLHRLHRRLGAGRGSGRGSRRPPVGSRGLPVGGRRL